MELRLSCADPSTYTTGHDTSESSVWCMRSIIVAVLYIVCYTLDCVVRKLDYFFYRILLQTSM